MTGLDPYEELGVARDADEATIRKAYRKASKLADRVGGSSSPVSFRSNPADSAIKNVPAAEAAALRTRGLGSWSSAGTRAAASRHSRYSRTRA